MDIFCGNLPFDCSEEDLSKLFALHGTFSRLEIVCDKYSGKSRGFAFVVMDDDREAATAIGELNGHELNGRKLQVSQARPKREFGK